MSDLDDPPRPIPVTDMQSHPVGLRPGEALAGLGGLTLLAALFLPWFGLTEQAARVVAGTDPQRTAWQAFAVADVLLALVALLALALPVLAATQRAPVLPVATGVWSVPLALVATLLILVRIATPPGDDALVTVAYGAFVGLLGAMLALAGACLALRDEGT